MVEQEFYSLTELSEQTGINAEAFRQTIANNRLAAFLKLSHVNADWYDQETIDRDKAPRGALTAFQTDWSSWTAGLASRQSLYDYVLDGWFQIAEQGQIAFGVESPSSPFVLPYPQPEWFSGCFALELETEQTTMPVVSIRKADVCSLIESSADMTPTGSSNPLVAKHHAANRQAEWISSDLALLNQAAHEFWSTADRDDKATHTDKREIEAWLRQQGMDSEKKVTNGATIIRPEWARKGRPPKS